MEALTYLLVGAAIVLSLAYLRRSKMTFISQHPDDYVEHGHVLNVREHLNGPLICEGVLYGPLGKVTSRFVADMNVTWEGNVGTMTEHFRYDDGSTQDRCWTLALGNDGSVKATAPDVIGEGQGMAKGHALQLLYKLKLPDSAGGHVLDAVDWMYVVENGSIMNRSQFRKFGIKVAELVATMRKVDVEVKKAA
ncbi:DUF3833 family protein [uncultured Litoreibacter sp.]|uniref:DUF3833 family protein n=1 Tax=uncultured Litoreibacter sp. TaxID=1392394 RepID=UPI0026019D52|nr:DUF3833 family protein [uncultured Litoreibacter sp.]